MCSVGNIYPLPNLPFTKGSFLWTLQYEGNAVEKPGTPERPGEINFYVSVVVLIAGGVLSVSGDASLFEFNVDLYGPLANNLRMVLVYLALTEVFLGVGCFLSNIDLRKSRSANSPGAVSPG